MQDDRPPRRPALPAAASFLAGTACAIALPCAGSAPAWGAAALGAGATVLGRYRPRTALATCWVALWLAGLFLAQRERELHAAVGDALFPDGAQVRELHLRGVVLAAAERDWQGRRRFLIRGGPEGAPSLNAQIQVHVDPGAQGDAPWTDGLRPGERVRVWCRLRRAAHAPHHAIAQVKSERLVERAAGARGGHGAAALRALARGRLDRTLDAHSRERDLLAALLLGERAGITPAEMRTMRDAGVVHIVAISGVHVAIVVALVAGTLQRSPLGRWVRPVPLLLLLACYAPAVGGQPPVVRSALGAGVLVVGRCLGREGEAVNGLAWIAALLSAFGPGLVSQPGFQLTFVATLGILLFARRVADRLPLPQLLAAVVGVSVAAHLATAPVVAWHFGHLAPIGLLTNVVAVPVSGVALVAGYLAVLLADLGPLGTLCGRTAAGSAALFADIAALGRDLGQGGWVVGRPAPCLLVAYYGALVALAVTPRRRGWDVLARGMLLAATVLLHVGPAPEAPGRAVELAVLDVGQGLAVAVHGPEGRQFLVDAGGRAASTFDPGERVVLPHLLAHGGRRLEALVLTHEDVDHAGGAFAVLRYLEVGELWLGPGFHRSARLSDLAALARERGTAVVLAESGGSAEIGGVPLAVLGPHRAATGATDNEGSVVLLIGAPPARALLTGDIGLAGEAELLRRARSVRAEFLVVAHHGSRNGTGPEFLARVWPRQACVSCGLGNPFGHPHPDVLRRLRQRGVAVSRTDRDGTVRLRAGAAGWTVLDPLSRRGAGRG